MGQMVRKQVYITAEHEKLLKRRANELGVTEADLIRRALDLLGNSSRPRSDRTAWDEELEFIRQRTRLRAGSAEPDQPRGWTRAELYEE